MIDLIIFAPKHLGQITLVKPWFVNSYPKKLKWGDLLEK